MQIKYRFSINGTIVNPIFPDTLAKEYNMESDQRFFRAILSGDLIFQRDDFDYINGQPFETEFELLLEKKVTGGNWESYFIGKFYKTNCSWDEDDKSVKVKIDAKDQYTDVLKNWGKEYNLIKLAPAKTELEIQKRPLLQIYSPGENLISAFLSGITWEQDLNFSVSDTNDLVNIYKFTSAGSLYSMDVRGNGTPADVVGTYISKDQNTLVGKNGTYRIVNDQYLVYRLDSVGHGKTSDDVGSIWNDGTNDWKIIQIDSADQLRVTAYFHTFAIAAPPDTLTHVKNATNTANINYTAFTLLTNLYQYALERVSDDAILFYSKNSFLNQLDYQQDVEFLPDNGTGTMLVNVNTIDVYMRYLLDVDEFNGSATFDIPEDDLVAYNRNYRKVAPYDGSDMLAVTTNTQTDPTEYGLAPDGSYYTIPSGGASKYFPIAKSQWVLSSVWLDFDEFDKPLEQSGRKPFILRDATPIDAAIKALLAVVAPSIQHEATTEYSEFLYASVNPISGDSFKLMITQKTNLLIGEYDQPAQKAPITFTGLMTLLRSYQLYWYIDDTNKLKIEHISWFKNGQSYSPNPQYNIDLTKHIQPINNKPWAYETSKYEYDKAVLPERIEFNWMDDVTLAFDGYPIEILSNFVEEGNVEEFNTGDYTSDVDFMLLAPEKINDDGFALFAAELDDTNLFSTSDPGNVLDVELNPVDGTGLSSSLHNTSGYIAVIEEQDYTFSSNHVLCWYGDTTEASFISSVQFSEDSNLTQTAPSGANYLRVSVLKTEWSALQVKRGKDLNGIWVLPFISKTLEGALVEIQNGYASWLYIHPEFWVYDLPSTNVDINNGESVTVQGVMRTKKQEPVNYPSIADPDPLKLIKTYLGDGEIEKISVNLSSRNNIIELRYDTE